MGKLPGRAPSIGLRVLNSSRGRCLLGGRRGPCQVSFLQRRPLELLQVTHAPGQLSNSQPQLAYLFA